MYFPSNYLPRVYYKGKDCNELQLTIRASTNGYEPVNPIPYDLKSASLAFQFSITEWNK